MFGASSDSLPIRAATKIGWPSVPTASKVSGLAAATRISGHGCWNGFGDETDVVVR